MCRTCSMLMANCLNQCNRGQLPIKRGSAGQLNGATAARIPLPSPEGSATVPKPPKKRRFSIQSAFCAMAAGASSNKFNSDTEFIGVGVRQHKLASCSRWKPGTGKGVASHPGPESCVYSREGVGEALTGNGRPTARPRDFSADFSINFFRSLSVRSSSSSHNLLICACQNVLALAPRRLFA